MVDKLSLIRGKDIHICDGLTMHQPTLTEIEDFGEERFYSIFWMLCSIPSDMKSILADNNIDYTTISEWQFFLNICKGYSKEQTQIIFGEIDFSQMIPMVDQKTEDIFLVNPSTDLVISESIYLEFVDYLRAMIGYTLKREKPANRITKKMLINEDRKNRARNKDKPFQSTLFSSIVTLVNTEEFSYTYETVFELTIYQLMMSMKQIPQKKSAIALLQGSMSGFVDTSKIPQKSFQWVYEDK